MFQLPKVRLAGKEAWARYGCLHQLLIEVSRQNAPALRRLTLHSQDHFNRKYTRSLGIDLSQLEHLEFMRAYWTNRNNLTGLIFSPQFLVDATANLRSLTLVDAEYLDKPGNFSNLANALFPQVTLLRQSNETLHMDV